MSSVIDSTATMKSKDRYKEPPVKGGSALIGCLDSAYASLGILLLQDAYESIISFSFIYFSYLSGTRGSSIGSLLLLERVLLVVITSAVSNSTTSILGVIYSSFIRDSPYVAISGVLTAALWVYRCRLCRTAYPAPPVWLSQDWL